MPVGFLVFGLVFVAIVIVALYRTFNHPAPKYPSCGACGYNLTGCPSNRCPECGKLMIEAGVILPNSGRVQGQWLAPLLIGVAGFLLLMAVLLTYQYMAMRAQRASALAVRAQALAAQRAATATQPAADDAGEPAENP